MEISRRGGPSSLQARPSVYQNNPVLELGRNGIWVEPTLQKFLPSESDKVIRCEKFRTVRKLRFVEPYKEGIELNKLFSVNYINDAEISKEAESEVLDSLSSMIKDFDLVLVMDFGHGLMTSKIRELVQEKAPFLSLNCQTNSYNHSYNIINRQYQRADSFSLDETEIKLASGIKKPDFPKELSQLRDDLSAKYAWLTRGAVETIGHWLRKTIVLLPFF